MKKNKIALAIVSILVSLSLYSQEDSTLNKEFLKENVKIIESIQPSYQNDVDLSFFNEELSNVNIVMLGEQAHGDGSTFLAKTRLIKYFHEKLDFNVLVFESGLFDMYRVWNMIQEGADSLSVFDYGVFPVWTNSKQVQSLFQYILDQSKTSHPLIVAGFDMQITGTAIKSAMRWDELKAYLSENIQFKENDFPNFVNVFTNPQILFSPTFTMEQFDTVQYEAEKIKQEILKSDASLSGKIYARYIDNYIKTLTLYKKADMRNPLNTPHIFNIRDKEMAENFQFVKDEMYKNEKCIVWGANSHLGYGRGFLDRFEGREPSAKGMIPMGQYLKIDYQEKLYTIAFTSAEGSIGSLRGQIRELPKAHPLSFENKMLELGSEYAFLSLKNKALQTLRFPTRIYGHAEMSGIWAQMADGIFFIKTMMPSGKKE